MDRPGSFGRWLCLWAIFYTALVVVVVWSLFAARQWALENLGTAKSVAAWEIWRADVRAQQDHPAPVQRRVPKSAEPPALVMMRDYFGVSLTAAILFSSVLYWVTAWLVNGMLRTTTDCRVAFISPPSSGPARRGAGRPGS
jgi:hypothetical protein